MVKSVLNSNFLSDIGFNPTQVSNHVWLFREEFFATSLSSSKPKVFNAEVLKFNKLRPSFDACFSLSKPKCFNAEIF